MGEPEDIVGAEAGRVVLDALTGAYKLVHLLLGGRVRIDGDEVPAQLLSDLHTMLALALRAAGSSGGEALDA